MRKAEEYSTHLYLTDEYVRKHPSIHEEDSAWKVTQIIPLIDSIAEKIGKQGINLLDVGGGAGFILKDVSSYIEQQYGLSVNKYALDLSPGMLEIQKERNPDLERVLNEDIRHTSLRTKEIDITLMIDVLEHVPNAVEALEEVKRISRFAIFKVPLEDNLHLRSLNLLRGGKVRQRKIENSGHINVYRLSTLRSEIEEHTGEILVDRFTNVFEYYRDSDYYKAKMRLRDRLLNRGATRLFKLSPRLCSMVFTDFLMVMVECAQAGRP